MTRIGLNNSDVASPPKIIDACVGTAGFLIEAMAYLLSGLRDDTRFTNTEKEALREKICNEQLFGIEANERVARIARINMYLHGDGGSHIFCGDGLDDEPEIPDDAIEEHKQEIKGILEKVVEKSFDLVLTNPPFSMSYNKKEDDEARILGQRDIAIGMKSAKSNILFLDKYHSLLKSGGEILLVIDDTVLNGTNQQDVRKWILDRFIVLGVHSLPFNAFFKAKANIKTSILHLRKKKVSAETQGHIFMSISNNIGHDNSLRNTPDRNNLTDILVAYLEWKRTGKMETVIKDNHDKNENLECPEQIWILPPEQLTHERLDAFFYAPELNKIRDEIKKLEQEGAISILSGDEIKRKQKVSKEERQEWINSKIQLNYIEISDVTDYGLPINHITSLFENIPSRGEYQVFEGNLLYAINISSRGTAMLIQKELDEYICTSGFWVITPKSQDEGLLLWYSLRGDLCKKQAYYLSQTASQPELKWETWKKYFLIPIPLGKSRSEILVKCKEFQRSLKYILNAKKISM
jgi:type I restriction enzyme M protein